MTHYRKKPEHHLIETKNQIEFLVILVEPKNSLNIGSVARSMDNFGFQELRLVSPRNLDIEKVQVTACWAKDRVSSIVTFDSLEHAIADVQDAVGFGTTYSRDRISHLTIGAWLEEQPVCAVRRIALVFGSEDQGLSNEQVKLLRTVVRIPSNADNPSLNLAQSVTVVLYELSKLNWPVSTEAAELVEMKEYAELQRKLASIMELSGFLNEHSSQASPRVLYSLLRRLQLDKRELAIAMGLCAKVINGLEKCS